MKIFHTDKKKDKYIFGYFDIESDETCFFRMKKYNLTGKRCGNITTLDTIAESNLGLTIFSDHLLEGVVWFKK